MKPQSKAKTAYEFLKKKMEGNEFFRGLSSEEIDIIIYNQLKLMAKKRGWVKNLPKSIYYHR